MAECGHDSPRAVFLSGKQVYLRPIEEKDLPLLQTWANDAEIRGLTGEVPPTSFPELRQNERRYSSENRSGDQ
jgi:RimJ/RimL family protein N-acetyltransferase